MQLNYYHLDKVDSTNGWAKKHMGSFARDAFTVVSASEQTAGRGRNRRVWHSPKGQNLYISFAFFSKIQPFFFSQIAPLCLLELLRELGIPATIKWPNDLLVDSKKIGGVLTEVESIEESNEMGVVVGIGLNINMQADELTNIPKAATSILLETKKESSLASLTEKLATCFIKKNAACRAKRYRTFSSTMAKRDFLDFI